MASKSQIIDKLNEIRATEQRMGMIYRRAAQMITGPYRAALAAEFTEHAADEDSHADYAMSRIMALGGDVSTEVPPLPVWTNLKDMLNSLDELEEEGIRKWQDLERMLPKDDPFRHTISSIIDREVDHSDDAKKWLRQDFAAKSMGDHGSIKPLNWQDPNFGLHVRKSAPWQERLHTHSLHGTPPTKRGAFNGGVPTLAPSLPAEMNPALMMSKAVLEAAAPKGSGKVTAARKRDASGKFVQQQAAGVQSTAAEDVEQEKQKAKLRTAKQREQVRKPFQEAKAGKQAKRRAGQLGLRKAAPGLMSMADSQLAAAPQMDNGQVMAQLSDGTPLYSDPYHPSHEQLTPEQHEEAAEIHEGLADAAFASGDSSAESEHIAHADIHSAQAMDNQSPMDRAMGRLANAPGQGQQPDMGMGGPDMGMDSGPSAPPPMGGEESPPPPMGGEEAPPPMGGDSGESDDEDPTQKLQNAFKALNYSYAPDDLDQFTNQRDMNKPSFGQRTEGPAPGMQHTDTGGPVGPQTDAMGFNQPAAPAMAPPSTPDAGQAPMDISAQGMQPNMDAGMVPPMPGADAGMGMDDDEGEVDALSAFEDSGPVGPDMGMGGAPDMGMGGAPEMGGPAGPDMGMGGAPEGLHEAYSIPEPPPLSDQDKHTLYDVPLGLNPQEQGAPMDMAPPPPPSPEQGMGMGGADMGMAPPTPDQGPATPFSGNNMEDKANEETAPAGPGQDEKAENQLSDQSNPFGQPRPANEEGGTEGPSNESKDEKKTFGLDALKSWSARYR